MNPKSLAVKIPVTLLLLLAAFTFANAQTAPPRRFSEAMVLRSLRTIHGAQATYQATYGNGNFGSLQSLFHREFIDEALASGSKYGYIYVVSIVPYAPPSTPPTFTVTATPRSYRKTGLRSFFIATDGVLRGADRQGAPADENDPEIDLCLGSGLACYEGVSVTSLRTLHGAEATYAATSGNGNFGTLSQLANAGLISQSLGDGTHWGYSYTVTTTIQTGNTPAGFAISAVPVTYGVTGFRSFYIATSGVIHGADRNGGPADENDPPIYHLD